MDGFTEVSTRSGAHGVIRTGTRFDILPTKKTMEAATGVARLSVILPPELHRQREVRVRTRAADE